MLGVWIFALIIWILAAHSAHSQNGLSEKQAKALLKAIEKKEYYEKVVIPGRDSTISRYNDAVAKCKSTINYTENALSLCELSNDTKQKVINNKDLIITTQKKKIRGKNMQIITAVAVGVIFVILK